MSGPSTPAPSLSERLQTVTGHLAAARTQDEVFGVVLTPALQALEAIAGAVLLVDETGERLTLATTQGHGQGARTLWQDGPLDGTVPAGAALERREPLFFEAQGDLVRAYPELEARTGGVAAVATAVLPMFLDDAPLGAIVLDFKEPHHFTPDEVRFLRTLAAQCAVALGRARLLTDLQRQVDERARQLQTNARAQEAFVAFTEAVGTQTQVSALAQQAITVLGTRFPGGNFSYFEYEPRSAQWQAQVWSDNHSGPQVAMITAGFPSDTPVFADVLRTKRPVFRDGWDAAGERIEHTEEFGIGATYPLVVGGAVRGILGMAVRNQPRWEKRDQALVRAVGRGLNLALERAEQTQQLQARQAEATRRSQALTAFAELSCDLVLETDPIVLIRRTQEIVLGLLPAGFSAYFEPWEGLWRIGSQVGHANTPELQMALDTGLPFEAALNLVTPWRSGEPHYQDEYDPELDQLSGSDEYPGASVTMPVVVNGQTRGILGLALYQVRHWSGEDRAVLETVGHQLALALERAEQTRRLEAERAALDAFVAFSEVVGTEMDEIRLAGRALDVLRVRFADCSGGYYQRAGELWQLRTWTSDLDERPEFLAALCAGLPSDTPFITGLLGTHAPTFTEQWNAEREHIENSGVYGTVAAYPVMVGGEVRGFFTVGLKNTAHWPERDRAIFRSVGRGLDLALERAERVAQQERQTAELDARTRALEGFADLTRDLSVEADPYVLVRRAQDVALSFLPVGYAVYFEPEGGRWVLHGQTGDLRSEALQAAADAGLPYAEANNLLIPFHSLTPYYQDQYALDTDHLDDLVAHLGASATLPVIVGGQPRGVFAVVLFGAARSWTRPDQAALESVVRSLGLALERAEGVALLAQRTQQLEHSNTDLARSNAELEQFAYVASHDLQAPIRAVTSFAGVLDKRYGSVLDDRGRLYLRQITDSGEHMKRLVDDLLAFSRIHTQPWALRPVDAAAVFGAVARRLEAQTPGADITCGTLPVVLADALQLDQLFQNLILNGLKYHRETVTPQVHVRAERVGELWRFAVRDNGIGIEPQYFERIFVIFQRLHGREHYEGTGIGLAVCKRIVERHGGRLWVESTPGEGTTFFFTVPAG